MDKKEISKLVSGEIRNLITLLSRAGVLKEVKRTGWVLEGVKNAESVADHTWRMSLLIALLTPKSLNKEKLLEMCIIHDLGEIGVGDMKLESGKRLIGDELSMQRGEMAMMNTLFDDYQNGEKYINFLKEYQEQKTPEARFLKQIDKVEMALQALEYEQRGYLASRLNKFWKNAEKYLEGQSLEPIFRTLQTMRREKLKSIQTILKEK